MRRRENEAGKAAGAVGNRRPALCDFGNDLAQVQPLDDVSGRRHLLPSDWRDQRGNPVGDAFSAAVHHWRADRDGGGADIRLHYQYLAWVACVGLFGHAIQFVGADMPAIFLPVGCGIRSGDRAG